MKLQIALDLINLQEALDIAKEVEPYCDLFEIGTDLLYAHGVEAVKQFRNTFAKKKLLVDTKIIDKAEPIVELVAHAGADWLTVMGGTRNEVIHSVCKEASKHNVKVLIDLLDAASPAQTALEAKNLGADALLFHQPYNEETALLFLDQWQMVKSNASLPLFISAHIDRETIAPIVGLNPHAIVIGRSIVQAEEPAKEAAFYYEIASRN